MEGDGFYNASGEISYKVLWSSWKLLTALRLNADLVGASDGAYSDLVSKCSSK
jgi:hypothetical protein